MIDNPREFWMVWFEDDDPSGDGDGHFLHFTEASAIESAIDCARENGKNVAVLRCAVTRIGVAEYHAPDYQPG